ncbi:hypothetical protein [Lentzea sp. NPDC059081]|uniref:hypothetical protein n=1 Tax=Lentzea sp. NPDC059081 TaxID=3346719 RepID=UPI00367D466A
MEAGDAAAWFAVAVALIAAFIALGNANSAKRQARAAEAAIGHAKRSAKAAEDQAEAAREQVALMRQQLDLEEGDRRELDTPKFEVEWCRDDGDGWGAVKDFTLKYLRGPAFLDQVELTLLPDADITGFVVREELEDVGRFFPVVKDREFAPVLRFEKVSRGTVRTFKAEIARGSTSVVVGISSSAGAESWPTVPAKMVDIRQRARQEAQRNLDALDQRW